jgi:GNAT superfamily N-acetyltransferase
MATCENNGCSIADSTREDLLSNWQQADFHLANDAWVIVTTGGQIAGFACVWHKEYAQISLCLIVHPQYRGRGIGTLLLRLAEERARQWIRLASPDVRVVLFAQLSQDNQEAGRLFAREGYKPGRQFLRISFVLAEDTGVFPVSDAQKKLRADVSLEHGRLSGATPLYDRDGLCRVCFYRVYEKELRVAGSQKSATEMQLDTMVGSPSH